MWTNRHKGERVIIGGASPRIHNLPVDLLYSGPVIGINRWAEKLHCDYWIGLDTGKNWRQYHLDDPRYPHLPKFLRDLDCPKFMRKPNATTEKFVPPDAGIFFSKAPAGAVPTEWSGSLQWVSSTALAAINLAIIMGAAEVVLYGVDFVGAARADGTEYPHADFWDKHRDKINNLLVLFQRHATIYRTHPDSWLACPMLPGVE